MLAEAHSADTSRDEGRGARRAPGCQGERLDRKTPKSSDARRVASARCRSVYHEDGKIRDVSEGAYGGGA